MWLLPSLDRPASLARFFEAYRRTGGSTPGLVLIDVADFSARASEYKALDLPEGWEIRQTQGRTQGDKIRWAQALPEIAGADWIGYLGDDCVPETTEWDRLMLAALDGANMVSCNDGWQAPKRIGNCAVVSGDLVRAVGWFWPPELSHLYIDDIWETLGRAAGAWTVLMDVMVRHVHVLKGEAPRDATHDAAYGEFTDRREARGGFWQDKQIFARWLEHDYRRAFAAAKLLRIGRGLAVPVTADQANQGRGGPLTQEQRMERVKSRRPMICVPIYGRPAWQFALALTDLYVLMTKLGMAWNSHYIIGSSNLPQARNNLVAQFMASDCDEMVFIDDDMQFKPGDIIRLLASERDLIAAVGRKRCELPNTDPNVWCWRPLTGPTGELTQDDWGAVEAIGVGTGCMKITRTVFEQLAAAHPEWKRKGFTDMPEAVKRWCYRFFRFPDDLDDMSEDYAFCESWRAIGGRVWIDPTIELGHVGEWTHRGRIADHMQVDAEPAARPVAEAAD